MNATFVVVPPGGGEADYQFSVDLPAIPHDGDYVQVWDATQGGYDYFIVRRRWFNLKAEMVGQNRDHSFDKIIVEVEFAKGSAPSANHKASCEMYEKRGKIPKEYEVTAY